MDYKIELTEQQAQPVVSMRFRASVGDLPGEFGRVYGTVIHYLAEIGENPSGAAFAAYYNMDTEDLDVEAGFPVAKPLAGQGEIKVGEIPAGKQVSCFHKGPYAGMEPVYNAMTQWMNQNGHVPTGTVYEFYYNSPAEVPESELLTKIVFPVK
jgi:effector-binding domain-containing protein